MEEIWKDIHFKCNDVIFDYTSYQISNRGRVRNKSKKILKANKNHYGYLMINLSKNGKAKTFLIHRLVAFMFVDGYFNGAEVNHIDENKENNDVNNLEWCTHIDNINHGNRNKKQSVSMSGDNHLDYSKEKNPYAKKVAQYEYNEKTKEKGELIKIWNYIGEASVELKINWGNISSCCRGRLKSAGGFVWEYVK